MQIEITPALMEDKPILRRMLELYSYDFSEYEDSDLDAHGCFGYRWLDDYWTDEGRFPFLARADGKLAGFVLVNQYTHLPASQWAIAEFFIMRKYRRQGLGKRMAFFIFDRFPGKWEVHQLESNLPSQHFWRNVIAEYTHGQFTESFLEETGSRGPIQAFDNSGNPGSTATNSI